MTVGPGRWRRTGLRAVRAGRCCRRSVPDPPVISATCPRPESRPRPSRRPRSREETLPDRPSDVRPLDVAVLARIAAADLNPGSGPGPVLDGPTRPVTGVTLRAAEVRPGDLFAALPGARAHGADFAGQALSAGAVAILTDPDGLTRPDVRSADVPVLVRTAPREALGPVSAAVYGEPTARLRVLGVTGTSGKTTVGHLLEAGLVRGRAVERAARHRAHPGVRARGAAAGAAQRVHHAGGAGPAGDVRRDARGGRDRRGDGGLQPRAGARPGRRHAVRGRGVHQPVPGPPGLPPDDDRLLRGQGRAVRRRGTDPADRAVVCVDDEWGRQLARPAHRRGDRHDRPVDVGDLGREGRREPSGRHADVRRARAGRAGPAGHARGCPAATTWPTRWSRSPCLDADGIPPAVAAEGFATLAVPGRMQRVDAGQDFLAVVDYAHKPAAVAALLDALRAQVAPSARVVTVLGCGGDRDRAKRPMMGAAATIRSDLLVVTDDNPRTEDPAEIRAEMMAGASGRAGPGELVEIGDRRAAIVHAVRRGPARRRRRGGRQGTRDRAGAGRGEVPVRRRRRGGRGNRGDRPMIGMTLSEVAAVTGGTLHRGRPATSDGDRRRVRLAQGRPRRAVPGAARRARGRARLRRVRRRRAARSRCWPRARWTRRPSSSRPPPAPRAPTWARPTRTAHGAAVLAALGGCPGTCSERCPGSPSSASPAARARRPPRTCWPPCSRRWARRGAARVVQQRAGHAVDRAARGRGHPAPGAGVVRPRARAHRRAVRGRAAADRGRAQRRLRPPRRVRLPGGDREGQGRARRGAAPGRGRRAQRRRPGVARDGVPHRRPGGDVRARRGRRRRGRPRTSSSSRAAPGSPWSPRQGRRAGGAAAGRRAPGVATRWPRPPSRWSSGPTSTASRRRWPRPGRRRAGGWRSPTARRGHRRQRRLQRQPGVDAGGARRAGRAGGGAGPAHAGRCSARWPSSARRSAHAHAGDRRAGPGAGRRTGWSPLGRPDYGDARRARRRRRRPRSSCCAPSWSRVTSCWSRPRAVPAWNGWPPACWSGRRRPP